MLKQKSNTSIVALGLLLLITIESLTTTKALFPKPITVQVSNWLSTKEKLTAHCKDKHHDIGVKELSFLDSFDFKFWPDPIFSSSLYFCGFTWAGVLHWFDIYNELRDQRTCVKHCNWIIVESGPCLYQPEGRPYNKCFVWDTKSEFEPAARKVASFNLSGLVNQTTQAP